LHEVLAEIGAAAMRGDAVPLVVRVPYGTEAAGLDRPVGPGLAVLEGIHVACGSSGARVAALLRWALERAAPAVLLEPRSLPARDGGDVPEDPTRARLVREGRDVTLAAWGGNVAVAAAAAESLAREGIEADVIDLVSLSPIDRETLGERVRATGRLVVVHPDDAVLAARIHDVALDEAFLYLEAPLAESGASASRVVGAARDAVRY
jgi:pyruvate/2-oxoglutarate/acetoin dehydrogenase E1 component